MDDTFDIKNDDINVEEIMKKIKENIAERKSRGAYTEEDKRLIDMDSELSTIDTSQLNTDYLYISKNWNIENNTYQISSHRTLVGPILIKSRQAVNNEVKRYIDPVILKQNQYNLHLSKYLNNMDDRLESLKTEMNVEIEKKVNEKVNEILCQFNIEINNRSSLLEMLSKRLKQSDQSIAAENPTTSREIPIDYLAFENRFRGSPNAIRERQSKFIKYFEVNKEVLDIGCGRGEFLELCKENNIKAVGIDTCQDMVDSCVSRGLDVKNIDAKSYLSSCEDNSIGGVFMDQVIEHLEPAYIVELLELCHRKMSEGGHIIIETVNPICLIAFVNFYIDMTHNRPMHPETLRFLMEYTGFRENSYIFSSPFDESTRLKKMDADQCSNDREKNFATVYNSNVDKLNDLIYGPQDYAIVARK